MLRRPLPSSGPLRGSAAAGHELGQVNGDRRAELRAVESAADGEHASRIASPSSRRILHAVQQHVARGSSRSAVFAGGSTFDRSA